MLKKKRRLPSVDWEDVAGYAGIGFVILLMGYVINLFGNLIHNGESDLYIRDADALIETIENRESLLIVNTDSLMIPAHEMSGFVNLSDLELQVLEDNKTIVAKVSNNEADMILENIKDQRELFKENRVSPFGYSMGGLFVPDKPENKPQMLKLRL